MFRELFVLAALAAVTLGSVVPAFERDPEWGGRIVGGSVAEINQFPYQCSLRREENQHFCGCSIVNSRWVLSAAHCTIDRTAANTRVVVGTLSRTIGGVGYDLARIVNHLLYTSITRANDVSVAQTATVIEFNDAVQPIPLGTEQIAEDVTALVSGWGQTAHPGSASENLLFLSQQTLTNTACRSRHSLTNALLIVYSNICAGGIGDQGACMGDSGGPLVVDGVQIGIVSWGIACARGVPDVYTRVSSLHSWITSYTD